MEELGIGVRAAGVLGAEGATVSVEDAGVATLAQQIYWRGLETRGLLIEPLLRGCQPLLAGKT